MTDGVGIRLVNCLPALASGYSCKRSLRLPAGDLGLGRLSESQSVACQSLSACHLD